MKTIKIKKLEWMTENLNDTCGIPLVKDAKEWSKTKAPACCYYDNDADKGLLFNWYAVNTGKLAPEGWRVPTDNDWNTLSESKLKKLKWNLQHGGYRNFSGSFYSHGHYGIWWSATEYDVTSAWHRNLYYNYANFFRYYTYKECGFSVRLVSTWK